MRARPREFDDHTALACQRSVLRDLQLRFHCLCFAGGLSITPTKGRCMVAMAFHVEHGTFGRVLLDKEVVALWEEIARSTMRDTRTGGFQ
jgi:hypothetical protein